MKRNINKDIPEVSIIIPAYKANKTISRALKSIKSQVYKKNVSKRINKIFIKR